MNNHRQQQLINRQLFISCVVPVYNESLQIINFLQALKTKLENLTQHYEIIVIDDGSTDDTFTKIGELAGNHPFIKAVKLARNFGKEHALTAGLDYCSGEVGILLDADFQHPLELIDTFIQYWSEGYDMVYGTRQNRQNENFVKRTFAKFFYKLIAKISQVNIPADAGDFRLLDKKVIAAIRMLPERNRFMKGLYAWVGFKSMAVPFVVPKRNLGKSSWKFYRLFELAITGITSFSDVPLRIWSLIGLVISGISFVYGLFIVMKTLIFGADIPGYATIVTAIMFFGGVQLLSIGILGEYLARIFTEVKQRPRYIVAEKIGLKDTNPIVLTTHGE